MPHLLSFIILVFATLTAEAGIGVYDFSVRAGYDQYGQLVSEKQWHGGAYRYCYDGNNRLVTAESVASDGSDYSTAYSYDSRGNVTSILRKGIADRAGATKVFGTLDDITLGYDGNRISTVTSQTDAVPFEGQTGLGRNGSDMAVSYDSNGRLTYDETRGIDEIEYSNDGMPVRIRFRSGREQHDEWDALGNHLSTSYYSPDASGALQLNSRKEYTGDGIVTVDGAVTQSRIPGGYFSGGKAYRYISDYQGNNVAVTDTDGNIVQQTDYYPYGEPWTEPSGQPYLYSDNERLRLDGLNEYDFHARRLNSSLLSFSVWDPYAEKYPWLSPYGYCAGNPVMLTDHFGLFSTWAEAVEYVFKNGGDLMNYTIEQQQDLLWAAIDNNTNTLYTRDPSLDDLGNVYGRQDGVIMSPIAYPSKDISGSGNSSMSFWGWNGTFMRTLVPDQISIGVGYTGIVKVGGGISYDLNFILRGPEASWKPILSSTQSFGVGYSIGATINLSSTTYSIPTNEIRRSKIASDLLNTEMTYFLSGDFSCGEKLGLTVSFNKNYYCPLNHKKASPTS